MPGPQSPAAGAFAARLLALLRHHRLFAASLGVIVLAAIVVGGVLFFAQGERGVSVDLGGPLTYHPLPDLIADLKPSAKRSHHIKLVVVVQIPAQQLPRLTEKQVEIIAAIQTELRELSVEEVAGSAGVDRLRTLILDVVNRSISPAQARTVLFTQMVVD